MAVIKDIEVTVKVKGQALQEYDGIDQDELGSAGYNGNFSQAPTTKGDHTYRIIPDLISKYIEAQSGACFSIHYQVSKSFPTTFDTLSFMTYVDGTCIESRLLWMTTTELEGQYWRIECDGITAATQSGTTVKPFMFNEIELGL